MIYQKYIKKSLIILGFFSISACELPSAYVYISEEFNRESTFFLKGITSRDQVIICYQKSGTTPKQVLALAENECKKFSKRAIFTEQNLRVRPLLTPHSAIYQCTDKTSTRIFNSPYN